MSGEIQLGMTFGSYNSMTAELRKQYCEQSNKKPEKRGLESESIYKIQGSNRIVGNAFRELVTFSELGLSEYADAVIFNGDYMYGTASKNSEALDTFDYIQGKTQHAIDLNGNGTVDDGEIFDGKLDRDAYKKAKDYGDLRNYEKYHKEFTHD